MPAITWTTSGLALNPNGVPKTGLVGILSQAVPLPKWDPSLAQTRPDAAAGRRDTGGQERRGGSLVAVALHTLTVPTLLLQGRHDFLFDIDQAIAA